MSRARMQRCLLSADAPASPSPTLWGCHGHAMAEFPVPTPNSNYPPCPGALPASPEMAAPVEVALCKVEVVGSVLRCRGVGRSGRVSGNTARPEVEPIQGRAEEREWFPRSGTLDCARQGG